MSYFIVHNESGKTDGPYCVEDLRCALDGVDSKEEVSVWFGKENEMDEVKDLSAVFNTKQGDVESAAEDYDIDNDEEEDDDDGYSANEPVIEELDDNIESIDDVAQEATDNDVSKAPAPLKGRLKKLASGLMKNWRVRYFVLENGTFYYYEPVHLMLKGRYNLVGLEIVDNAKVGPETIHMKYPKGKAIILVALNMKIKQKWITALQRHIAYANYLASVDQQLAASSGSTKERRTTRTGSVLSMLTGRKATVTSTADSCDPPVTRTSTINSDNDAVLATASADAANLRGSEMVRPRPTLQGQEEGGGVTTGERMVGGRKATVTTYPAGATGGESSSRKMTVSANPTAGDAENMNYNRNTVFSTDSNQQEVKFVYVSRNEMNRRMTLEVADIAAGYATAQPCSGWLSKVGQIFPSVRRRWFVLEKGVMRYYAHNINELTKKTWWNSRPKGVVTIINYELYSDNSEGRIQLMLMPGVGAKTKRKLIIYCENFAERDMWVKAINAHIHYRDDVLTSV